MVTTFLLVTLLSPAAFGLMVARCPEGWEARGGTDQCYLVHSFGGDRTFTDARKYCKARGGDLAVIEKEGLRDWLGQLIAITGNVGQSAYMWVGAKKEDGEWKWVENGHTIDNFMLPWEGTGQGNCAALTANSKLIKQECSQKLKFICHRNIQIPLACDYSSGWEDALDRCYKKSRSKNSWHDSQVECMYEGSNLASISDNVEQQLAHDLAVEERDKVWIGYTESGHPGEFAWVDGSNSNITFWQENQPDLSLGGFGAAVVDNDDTKGQWVVEKVTNEFHYLCEKETGSCLPGWETFEDSCYYFNTESQDLLVWEDAKKTCEDIGASLVVMDSIDEDAFFLSHMPESDTLWLGLSSRPNDGMYWTDGTEMKSRNFSMMSEDDLNSAIQNPDVQCVYHQDVSNVPSDTIAYSWVTSDCHTPRHYVCEAPAGKSLTLIPPSNDMFCPDGWEKNENYCYYFSSEEKTWTSARTTCRNLHANADLVSIFTWSEQDYVHNNQMAEVWLGLNDRNEANNWVWADDTKPTILNWNTDEPNGEAENCVEMIAYSGKWNDHTCDQKRTFACKMKASTSPIGTLTTTTAIPDTSACGLDWVENPVTGECYRVVVKELSFEDATLHCLELFHTEGQSIPNLVSISSAQEQEFVYGLIQGEHLSQSAVWIGMTNDYEMNKWSDGTPSAYFNFEDGEPNAYFSEQCIEIYTGTGKWNDAFCDQRKSFVCEKKGRNYVAPQPPPPPNVLCPSGWSFWNNHCYYFSSEQVDWFLAENRCKEMMGSELASITNLDENNYIEGVLDYTRSFAWIGLRDDDNGNNWHWTDGSLYDWTNWGEGEPNNANGGEHCGEIRTNDYYYNGQWNDQNCNLANYYVCKMYVNACPQTWALNDGKCYYVSDYEATRNEGEVKCKEMNTEANLVNIHSEEENQYYQELLIQSSQSCWLGLKYNGTDWAWSDGQVLDYDNWNENEPNNLDTELCGEMIDFPNSATNGKWNNLDCSYSRAFGCELYPTHTIGCEEGWREFGDYCYYLSSDDFLYLTYFDARDECQSRGAKLASIHSAEEDDFLYSLTFYAYVFIGLTDENHPQVFTWDDGSSVVYTNLDSLASWSLSWNPSCAQYTAYLNTWVFEDCGTSSYFFCKKPKETIPLYPETNGCDEGDQYYEATCYHISGLQMTWSDAKSDCESRGRNLVTLKDRYETSYVSSFIGELGHRVWIGLSGAIAPDGSVTFTWIDGDSLEYSYWDRYEPVPDHGTCVSASGNKNSPGLWGVRGCDETFQYICEYERVGYTTHPPPTTKPPSYYCLYGWEHKGQSCYKVMQSATIWGEAEASCSKFGAHLVSINDVGEQGIIQGLPDLGEVSDIQGAVWVGLIQNGDSGYEWTDGSANGYIDWAEGQPDNHIGQEDCVSADVHSLKLSDTVCLAFLPYICEAPVGTMITTAPPVTKPPLQKCSGGDGWFLHNDYCYKFVSGSDEPQQTWWDAHKLCRHDGGELASILSFDENYWIESVISDMSDSVLWIGGRAKIGAGYEWIDGRPFIYDNWAKGEPNNVNDQEDCISMYVHGQGYWNDQNCGHVAGRICKRPQGVTHPPPSSTKAPDGHCPEGWLHTGTKCVYFITDKFNFTTSRKVCQKMGSGKDLASVHSAAEQAYLTAALAMVKEHMWLGMSYESGFFWVDQSNVDYTNWGPNEPNGGYNKEECVEVSNDSGLWNDISCSDEFGGICMMKQDPNLPDHHDPTACPAPHKSYTAYNGACYKAYDTAKTWEDAEATCAEEGAHLASIPSTADNSFMWVTCQQKSYSSLWIGLSNKEDRKTFKWSDAWPMVYSSWGRDEPAVNLTGRECVSVNASDGLWYTHLCDTARPFMCKYSNETAPTPDPPITGHCPDTRWFELGGSYCYMVPNVTKKWSDASQNCIQEGSNLASIHSREEMILIKLAMHKYNEPYWIGLIEKKNGPGWTDGSAFNYLNWENGEPNSDDEECTEVISGSGTWNDVSCDVTRYYLCKTLKISDDGTLPPTPTPPTTVKPGGGGSSSLSGGGIAGIVIAVLVLMGAAGFFGVTYVQKKPKTLRDIERHQHQSIDNIMYSGDNMGQVASGGSGGGGDGGKDNKGSVRVHGVVDGTDA